MHENAFYLSFSPKNDMFVIVHIKDVYYIGCALLNTYSSSEYLDQAN